MGKIRHHITELISNPLSNEKDLNFLKIYIHIHPTPKAYFENCVLKKKHTMHAFNVFGTNFVIDSNEILAKFTGNNYIKIPIAKTQKIWTLPISIWMIQTFLENYYHFFINQSASEIFFK